MLKCFPIGELCENSNKILKQQTVGTRRIVPLRGANINENKEIIKKAETIGIAKLEPLSEAEMLDALDILTEESKYH